MSFCEPSSGRLADFLGLGTKARLFWFAPTIATLCRSEKPYRSSFDAYAIPHRRGRSSAAIKYLTQSTWSHAALYVGSHLVEAGGDSDHCFIEVDMVHGVCSVSIEEFIGAHTRICRPIGLDESDCRKVTAFVIARLGNQYDLRNIIDLTRYLLPTPPVPQRSRRRMLALGSGDPTRAICSTLIARAFQSLHYPILPVVDTRDADAPDGPGCIEEILHLRHHGLFAPCDFDVSPYFQIVEPIIDSDCDFRALCWDDRP